MAIKAPKAVDWFASQTRVSEDSPTVFRKEFNTPAGRYNPKKIIARAATEIKEGEKKIVRRMR